MFGCKVDELASQMIVNKAQALDMQSHVLLTLDEVKEKWQAVHMQLSGQLHTNTDWSHTLRSDLTSKANAAIEQVSSLLRFLGIAYLFCGVMSEHSSLSRACDVVHSAVSQYPSPHEGI
jgi:hypothetical protein